MVKRVKTRFASFARYRGSRQGLVQARTLRLRVNKNSITIVMDFFPVCQRGLPKKTAIRYNKITVNKIGNVSG